MAKNGLSEYELQRNKNLEENRRILESIRQEQVTSFPSLHLLSLESYSSLVSCSNISLPSWSSRPRSLPSQPVPHRSQRRRAWPGLPALKSKAHLMQRMRQQPPGENPPGLVARYFVRSVFVARVTHCGLISFAETKVLGPRR